MLNSFFQCLWTLFVVGCCSMLGFGLYVSYLYFVHDIIIIIIIVIIALDIKQAKKIYKTVWSIRKSRSPKTVIFTVCSDFRECRRIAVIFVWFCLITVQKWKYIFRHLHHTTIKTRAEMRNVGDAAYAMSNAAAEDYKVHTAAGCRAWHWRVSGDRCHAQYGRLCEIMTSSTKPEIVNLLLCRQRRTEHQPQLIRTDKAIVDTRLRSRLTLCTMQATTNGSAPHIVIANAPDRCAICFHCIRRQRQLECGPMPNVMVALPNTGALSSTTQSLADAHY